MIVVVLPAYDEADALPPLLRRLQGVSVDDFAGTLSVIVVDDGSGDGTAEKALQAATGLAVRVVSHVSNRGLNEAIRTGLVAALERVDDNAIVITMDADDTQSPGLIAQMARLIDDGNDVVVASRYAPGGSMHGVSLTRRILSRGASMLFRAVYPVRGVRDYTCGYRAYRAGLLRAAFARWGDEFIRQPGFSCTVDILLMLSRLGAVVTEAPLVLRYDRKRGRSKMNVPQTVAQTLSLLVRRRLGMN